MKALLLLLFVGVAFATDCTKRQTKCQTEWSANSMKANSGPQICTVTREFENCLKDVESTSGCEAAVTYPAILNLQKQQFCSAISPETPCDLEHQKCKDEFDSTVSEQASAASNCEKVRIWQTCYDNTIARGICDNPTYPVEMTEKKNEFCEAESSEPTYEQETEETTGEVAPAAAAAASGAAPPSQSASQGPQTCAQKLDGCKRHFDKAHLADSKQVRCQVARNYRRCLELLRGECTVAFPRALDTAEATNCFGKTEIAPQGSSDGTVVLKQDANPIADPCSDAEKACEKIWLDARPTATTHSQICQGAKDWRACLDGHLSSGTCPRGVTFPQELDSLQANHCDVPDAPVAAIGTSSGHLTPQGALDCNAAQTDCKNTFYTNAQGVSDPSQRCTLAKAWRTCINGYRDSCSVSFPQELDTEQAYTCDGRLPPGFNPNAGVPVAPAAPQPAAPLPPPRRPSRPQQQGGLPPPPPPPPRPQAPAAPAAPAAATCDSKIQSCYSQYGRRIRSRGNKNNNCNLVRQWRTCIDPLRDDPLCRGRNVYPQTLNNAETRWCR